MRAKLHLRKKLLFYFQNVLSCASVEKVHHRASIQEEDREMFVYDLSNRDVQEMGDWFSTK